MPDPVGGNPARVAVSLQTQALATTRSLDQLRSADMGQQTADLQEEQVRVQAAARMARQAQRVGTILDTQA